MSVAKEMKNEKAYYIKYISGHNIPYIPNIGVEARTSHMFLMGDINPKVSFKLAFMAEKVQMMTFNSGFNLAQSSSQEDRLSVWKQFVNHIDKLLTGKAIYNS